jgi:predicted RNA-binding protein with PIN domain
MPKRTRYLIVDGHSVIFAWPDLLKLHQRRTALARDALAKRLRDYQDWTGVRVILVFDGRGPSITAEADPHEIQLFYSRKGQTADAIIERLAGKYAANFELMVATSDRLERQTVTTFGAISISPETLRQIVDEAVPERSRGKRSGGSGQGRLVSR